MEKKKLFVDLGAHEGSYSKRLVSYFDEVIAFEANSDKWPTLEKINGVTLYKCAAWIEESEINFYVDRKGRSKGSTPVKGKISGKVDYDNPIKVKAIDFSQWIYDRKENFIVVKVNIEGAEYSILDKMIEDNTLEHIDLLIVGWHKKKIGYEQKGLLLESRVKDKINVVTKSNSSIDINKILDYINE